MSLKGKYLYMYDVRGIQDYIFRTHKIKEIIGASKMVEDLIIRLFEENIEELDSQEKENCRKNEYYKNPDIPLRSLTTDVIAEILYYGGGNLYVIYKSKEIGDLVSKNMCMELIKQTYSLQLAVASVEISGDNNYKKDYLQLRKNMDEVKQAMPTSLPVLGFPITQQDPISGFPFSKIDPYTKKMTTHERYKKLAYYKKNSSNESININDFGEDDNSLVAIVHIDGNNMGKYVMDQISDTNTYAEATKILRQVSKEIQESFVDNSLVKGIENKLNDFIKGAKLDKEVNTAYRRIIAAGDDITFICTAKLALKCIESFMDELEKTQFHACVGMYICHNSFPFARAYEYAEELCSNAKKQSRKLDGNYIDFQLNTSGILNSIDVVRHTQYNNYTEEDLMARPYYINTYTRDVNGIKDLRFLDGIVHNLSRNKVKELRNSFYLGEGVVKETMLKINSRKKKEDRIDLNDLNLKVLFDAIDIMDLDWWWVK